MPVTPADFRLKFPEFANTTRVPDTMVQSHLDEALRLTPEDIWGDLQDDGVAWLAAHTIVLSPVGLNMRKGEKPGESAYGRHRVKLEESVGPTFLVF